MRGKAFCGAALWLPIRITPAYAGKRVAVESRSACVQDHPRVCGKKHCPRKKRLSWTESPPRMRGKGSSSFMAFTCAGITPACAGKSKLLIVHGQQLRDHPRVCGEKDAAFPAFSTYWGSPPRVRGKVCTVPLRPLGVGITPAYAGKSVNSTIYCGHCRDHPRVCGEKFYSAPGQMPGGGSPPRMRGKGMYAVHPARAWGITPAYAGKRALPCRWPYRRRDHPRVCGEKGYFEMRSSKTIGSPPRMRGKGMYAVHPARTRGITPAYAGKRAAPAVHGSSF